MEGIKHKMKSHMKKRKSVVGIYKTQLHFKHLK
jgi:hypothetical protein